HCCDGLVRHRGIFGGVALRPPEAAEVWLVPQFPDDASALKPFRRCRTERCIGIAPCLRPHAERAFMAMVAERHDREQPKAVRLALFKQTRMRREIILVLLTIRPAPGNIRTDKLQARSLDLFDGPV